MSNIVPQENKMGVMPVNRLLITMSVPMMLAMLVQALYNVVDSVFVSQLSEDALNAVSLAFPVQNIMIALAVGTGVGVNALLSKSLGEQDAARANRTAEHGVLLAAITCAVFMVCGTLLARPFYMVQVPNEPVIVEYGAQYMQICSLFSCGIFMEVMFERLLQSTGRTVYTMFTQGVGAVFNIIFDPLLIFGIGPFPRLEVAGAAVATVMGQIVAAVLAILFNHFRNHDIKLSLKGFRFDGWIVRRIYLVGAPSIIMNAIGSLMVFGMNQILLTFTKTATAVLGVYFKVQSFVFMPIYGLNNGMVPIIAYNYGARKKDRLLRTVKLGVLYAVLIMIVGLLVVQTVPDKIFLLFQADENMLSIGVPALRIISLSFVFAGYCVVASATFQALGEGIQSMIVSIVRQLVVLLPAAWLLAKLGDVNLVWYAFPIAELASLTLCTVFLVRTYRKLIRPLGEPISK
ncbi:MATE family efflux transporter [Pseudoflavonifractor capillosus]|uniref:MATE family efflux transporter n=1 Tax=Pseudoflavonifractor capillosus TaxID=106588 RepID=A0A921SS42_9FIRM|nr:MATE family efflux transporter [Pseudoflavonifractor capillosus]HJG85852.1 MATE family efflux transporter [Pseudoflavonifractor capillosus]